MNTQYLRYAVEVGKTKSITKAAQNLLMGQPNLSKAIRQLEQEAGMTIFNRTAKGVEVTRKGEEFLTYASTILSQIDELESLYRPHPDGCLRMNISVPRASYIGDAFARFVAGLGDEEQIAIEYRETDPFTILHQFADGETDLGIVRYQMMNEHYFAASFQDAKLQTELLWEYDMQILMAKDHPLAGMKEVPYHMLSGFIEIVHGDTRESPVALSELSPGATMASPSKKISIYERGSQFDLLQTVPGSFMWVSPVPQRILDENGLVQRPCQMKANLCRDVAVYPRGHSLTRYEQQFLSEVRSTVRNLQRQN